MLKKLQFRPGVNRENTRYTNENGWYESDKVRFRQGTPEQIGGWQRISTNTFLGVCRSLWQWFTLSFFKFIGVGTHLKFYIESGGAYYDITPLRATNILNGPFDTNGTTTVTVNDPAGGFQVGAFVTFKNAATVSGLDLNGTYQIQSEVSGTAYTITAGTAASGTVTGGGGSTVIAEYEIDVGSPFATPLVGWGGGSWGAGVWGTGGTNNAPLRLWSQANYGEDLIFGPRGGNIYYWDVSIGINPQPVTMTIASPAVVTSTKAFANGTAIAFTTSGELPTGITPGTIYYVINTTGTTFNVAATAGGTAINTSGTQSGTHAISQRGIPLGSLADSSNAPVVQNGIIVSDASRIVMCFGTNALGETTLDPMLIRWSDQENAARWTPGATNQAGDLRLSRGSEIIAQLQSRQEILVWTDTSLYGLQYAGPPTVWNSQILGDNISIISPNCVAVASGVVYWMGVDKFYKYDGRVDTLRCDLRRYVFNDLNFLQGDQIFAGTSEGFNEIWWFYCSANSNSVNRYVIYNYAEDIWYYGTMARTAWSDVALNDYPVAATYSNNLVNHELGLNDNETGTPVPINGYIQSAEFDLDDGNSFFFIWRVLPDITFSGSTAGSPQVTMSLYPLANSGSGYNKVGAQQSVGGSSFASITRVATLPVEQYTGQINTRVRGRQLAIKVEANQLDTTWQLGSPRIDIRPDGRK